jgi:hypothetical protein
VLWHAAEGWRGRLVAVLLAGGMVWTGIRPPIAPDTLVLPALVTLLLAVVLGAPIFVLLGGAALILFWGQDLPIASISLTHYSMVTNPTLPTVPLFTLAGYFLAEGGASKRLIRVFQAVFGQFRGGPAIVTVLACAFFTSFTGASGVTILALGGLLMPVLMGAGYSERSTLGLLTGSGGLGLLFPPSLPLILYAIVASLNAKTGGVTIEKMFLGGLGPGVLLVTMAAGVGILLGPKDTAGRPVFDQVEAGQAIWGAKWELLLPVVALVALFGGFATPVEAAAVRVRGGDLRLPRLQAGARDSARHGGLWSPGGWRATHFGRGAGVQQLPSRRPDSHPCGRMGHGRGAVQVRVPACVEPVLTRSGLRDGRVFRHRGGGAAHRPAGSGLRR